MKAYHCRKQVDESGSVKVADLPPGKEVEIIVLFREPSDLRSEMREWMAEVSSHHPFAHMGKDEILAKLRKTREAVWDEHHAN